VKGGGNQRKVPIDVHERLAALRREMSHHQMPVEQREQFEENIQDVNTAMEELRVMQEELLAQNQELTNTYEQLAAERQRYLELFDFAPDAYIVTTTTGLITEANRAAASLFNLKLPLLKSTPLATFVHPDDRPAFRKNLVVLCGATTLCHFKWRMCPRRQEPFDADASASVVRDPAGEIVSVRWLIRDVSHATAAAEQLHEYQRRLRALAAELSLAEERERRRIAIDIHDRISQNLAMAKMRLASIQSRFTPETKERVQSDFADAMFLLEQTLDDTRTLTFELSPPILYELGLVAALQWLAEQMTSQYGLKVAVDGDQAGDQIGEDLRSLLFRSTRELLINVVKHANATAARISVRKADGGVRITVADDGDGFDIAREAAAPDGKAGFGLFSMRTRLEQIGGKFEISSVPDTGTRVTLSAPLGTSSSLGGGNTDGDENSPGR
jgi:PAS domain S-box-containing protein